MRIFVGHKLTAFILTDNNMMWVYDFDMRDILLLSILQKIKCLPPTLSTYLILAKHTNIIFHHIFQSNEQSSFSSYTGHNNAKRSLSPHTLHLSCSFFKSSFIHQSIHPSIHHEAILQLDTTTTFYFRRIIVLLVIRGKCGTLTLL